MSKLTLRENLQTGEVFAVAPALSIMYSLDGAPWGFAKTCGETWPVVGEVSSLADWQAAPGAFGPTCATARVTLKDKAGQRTVVVGGNALAVQNWIGDQAENYGEANVAWHWDACYADRNRARAGAAVQL